MSISPGQQDYRSASPPVPTIGNLSPRPCAAPNILGSKACIRGMRTPVALMINLVANGLSVQEIVTEYPDLEPQDIEPSLRYAAWAV